MSFEIILTEFNILENNNYRVSINRTGGGRRQRAMPCLFKRRFGFKKQKTGKINQNS